MPRPTLVTGDIWTDSLANSAGYPTHNGTDEYGDGDPIPDTWLSAEPDQIKARFYGFYDRVKVSATTGRAIAFTGASILLANGSQATLNPGTLTLPADSTVFVFVNDAGAVTQAPSLPTMCIPLARATTNATTITNLQDLRLQVTEHVRPRNESGVSGFDIGDVKASARVNPSTGWVWADGARYNDVDFPLAATAIGRQYSQPSDPAGTFRVIDLRNRTLLGSSSTRPAGTTGGAETVALTAAQNGRHSHATTETPHNHSATDSGHSHGTSEQEHGHGALVGSGSNSTANIVSLATADGCIAGADTRNKVYTTDTNNGSGGRIIATAKTNVSIQSARASISMSAATTGLSVRDAGEGAAHDNMMPFAAANYFVRLF